MTIFRTLIWFALAIVAMFGAVWLAEQPGVVTAEFRGWRLDTSVGVMVVAVLLLMVAGVAGWLLWRWFIGAPGALLEGWGESRRRRGYRALTQGLAAVAVGDAPEAQKNARKAEALLAEPSLTLLLSAQAAQLAGDREGAKRAFDAMLEDEHTAVLGLRGLITQALRDGDSAAALTYAGRAFKLRPQTAWIVHSLFDMQAQIGQWKEAQETLESGVRRKVITPEQGRVLKALLLIERTRSLETVGDDADARSLAREAFALAPERIPVTQRYAELLLKAGEAKRASRAIERGWSLAPHPDLAALYLKASGEKDPLKHVAVMRRLAAQKPDDLESELSLARTSLDAGLWGEARRHLRSAGGAHPPARVCRLMAEVEERASTDPARVRDWLAKAALAPADRSWRCTACGARHENWRSVCESCGAFGTLQWREPGTYGQVLPPLTTTEATPSLAKGPALPSAPAPSEGG